ncbi:MAG: retroviral-like aspartic protease family protein [Paludibacter sp.]|nr:retroviral-like aspartic protease family protein [Paludibacter sp.]
MFVQQAFGNYKQAEHFAKKLKKIYNKTTSPDSIRQSENLSLLSFYALDAMQKFNYSQVAQNYEEIIKNCFEVLDSAQIENYKNSYALFSTLKNTPAQKISRSHQNIELQSFRSKFNHLIVPVSKGNVKSEFVFDTGASFAMISDSIAQLMNIKILSADVNVLTATNLQIQPQLAVADSFYVGDILFENLVFLVVPQSDLTFPQADYEIYGAIGFPQIMQMGEIRLQRTGKIIFPKKQNKRNEKNIFLDGYNPVIQVFTENDTLLFRLDTGAGTSELSYKYFEKYKGTFLQNAEIKKVKRGGAGGIQESEEYSLENFNYKIGETKGLLPKITVQTNDYKFSQLFDGNLGQDILCQYNEIVLNFKDLYLKLLK